MPIDYCGCIGFMRSKGSGCGAILSRMIRAFSAGEWSHVFIVMDKAPITGDYYIIEAGETGVRINLLSEYLGDPAIEMALYKPKVDDEAIDEGFRAVLPLNGKPYGYLQFLGFVVVWPYYMITGRRRKNPFGKGIICSELGLLYLQGTKVNSEVFDKMDLNLTSPEDLNDKIDTDQEHFELKEVRKADCL